MALDKDIIAGKVLGQGQRPAWLISQPDIGGVKLQNPDYASWPLDKRIAEAKKLLNEAGYNASHPLSFNLLYNTSESHQRIAIAASSMWKKNLGVEAKLQNQEWKTMLDTMHTHNFDAVRYVDCRLRRCGDLPEQLPHRRQRKHQPVQQSGIRPGAARCRKSQNSGERVSSTSRRKICWGVMCRPFRFITTSVRTW
jgi:hypothetical protein